MSFDTKETIKTLVVFDLETNGLPSEQFNKCSITELSIFAFSAQCLKENEERDVAVLKSQDTMEGIDSIAFKPPELPRVLHKLTLMINPMRMIYPESERITGLSNDMLCNESPFDVNTANCLLTFLERLQKPLCFVAHNGWSFDFPIIRHVFEKIKMKVPSHIYCIDSFKAFIEIDEKQIEIEKRIISTMEPENLSEEVYENTEDEVLAIPLDVKENVTLDPLEENDQINWQKANETTPHRKKPNKKRTRRDVDNDGQSSPIVNKQKRLSGFPVRRELFVDPFQPKSKYPPRGKYQLGNIYERIFKQPAENLHCAESDVMILTKLIIHYGLDFLAYAEERKESFDKVMELGRI